MNEDSVQIKKRMKLFKKDYEDFRSKATGLDQSNFIDDFEKVMMDVMESGRTGRPVENLDTEGENDR